ncbi:MAG: ligase-associated DNA damage response endonuclease PdeM [Pseudomonadota bacterium]
MIQTAEIKIRETDAVCDPLGALFLPHSATLIVSDLHLEKGAAFARRGMLLPPYDTAQTLKLVTAVINRYQPACVICLGDSFHDRQGAAALPSDQQEQIANLMARRHWFWIAGNHDPDEPKGLGGDCVSELYLEGLCFRHEPASDRETSVGEVSGHLHPAARVVRRGKGVRRPCFATDGIRMIMPSFGVTTGGLNLRNAAFAGLFDPRRLTAHLLGRERIYSVAFDRLIG